MSPDEILKTISEQLEKQGQEIAMVQEKVMMVVERILKRLKLEDEKYV